MRCSLLALTLVATLPLASIARAQSALVPGFDAAFLGNAESSRAWGVAVADFTSDGIADVVSGNTAGDVHLFEGQGDGTFVDRGRVINMFFNDAYALVAADFDRNGTQDFVLSRTGGSTVVPDDGTLLLYLGNGDGTFQSVGFPQFGIDIGDAGTDALALAVGDVDNDNDVDIIAGDRALFPGDTADVTLFRNDLEVLGGALSFTAEPLIAGVDRGFSPVPDEPPYFPPNGWLEAYGLALADADNDGDLDLLLTDSAPYLYVYRNDGSGSFAPVFYDNVPGGTRPFAFDRIGGAFTFQAPLAAGDLNGDGFVDFAASLLNGDTGDFPGEVSVWINAGVDGLGRPDFVGGGVVGGVGTDARGLAVGQLDPDVDLALDLVFGNFQGDLYALFADLTDTDGDGIIDDLDNAPLDFNPPILDMNTDGAINRFDQLDADDDGAGDPADPDDDNDDVPDDGDNCPFTPNGDQSDADGDGLGDACDPRNDLDADADGVTDGPLDPALLAKARDAKARWARSDTHFGIRVDALSRAFQNEFTQTLVDGATLTPEAWAVKKFDNYNGVGDAPALPGYQVPGDLPGGRDTPLTLVIIPKLLWNAFGDPDPIQWVNDRNANPNLEIGQHGTYHANNTPLGDWASQADRFFFSCDECGFDLPTIFQYLRIGKRTLLGDYLVDPWIRDAGVDAGTPRIDWSDAANPLITYSPPFNASDPTSREAEARLGYAAFSASVFEENSPIFTPEGSHQDDFDGNGMFHASADVEVEPEPPAGFATYAEYLESITVPGTLNTWLIEEVEWGTRYCNDQERLTPCAAAPGGINRENNMVDLERWSHWLQLLDHANANGEVMTLGDYALAVATDNCVGIPNPEQSDRDADGLGDPCDPDRIDVKPGSDPNSINLRSRGLIPVAVLGSDDVDVSRIDATTLAFGPAGAAPAHGTHLEDVDEDGFVDLLGHFETGETGIEPGAEEACLSGVIAGTAFQACDAIRTVPRRP
jgi:hypothetical protein